MNRYQNALDRLICNIGVTKSNYMQMESRQLL